LHPAPSPSPHLNDGLQQNLDIGMGMVEAGLLIANIFNRGPSDSLDFFF